MKIFIALLYVVSAVLPFLGIWSLWKKAQRNSRRLRDAPSSNTPGIASYGQLREFVHQEVPEAIEADESARQDLWLIGAGLAFGAIASIWSLWL